MKFHTALAALMTFINEASEQETLSKNTVDKFILLVSPFAPHLAEELWEIAGHKNTLAYEPWPEYDAELAKSLEVTYAIQVNGKLRETILVPAGMDKDSVLRAVKGNEKIASYLAGKEIAKEVYVPERLVNFVVKG
jgi:leucyl-tRNA synthetase